jgi:flagellar hook-basal body complex protein FliE
MIDPVSSSIALQQTLRARNADGVGPAGLQTADGISLAGSTEAPATDKTSFSDLVTGLVRSVDAKGKAAESEARRLMVGESDNIHRTMISMQEAGVAFNLLVEVRNKLVESYQELMRMPV